MRHTFSAFASVGLLIMGLLLNTASYAIERPLPKDAQPGQLNLSDTRAIMIDKKERRLAAGIQIRDQHNRIVQSTTLADVDAPILYKQNNQGQITRIWMLTEDEQQQYRAIVEQPKRSFRELVKPTE